MNNPIPRHWRERLRRAAAIAEIVRVLVQPPGVQPPNSGSLPRPHAAYGEVQQLINRQRRREAQELGKQSRKPTIEQRPPTLRRTIDNSPVQRRDSHDQQLARQPPRQIDTTTQRNRDRQRDR